MADRLVKTAELAREIGVKPSTVRGYVASGRLVPDRRTPGNHALFDLARAKRTLGLPNLGFPEDTGSMTMVTEIPSAFADALATTPAPAEHITAGHSAPSRAHFDAGFLGGEHDPLPDYQVTDVHAIFLERGGLER
jgi:hypothetical protein